MVLCVTAWAQQVLSSGSAASLLRNVQLYEALKAAL